MHDSVNVQVLFIVYIEYANEYCGAKLWIEYGRVTYDRVFDFTCIFHYNCVKYDANRHFALPSYNGDMEWHVVMEEIYAIATDTLFDKFVQIYGI